MLKVKKKLRNLMGFNNLLNLQILINIQVKLHSHLKARKSNSLIIEV